MPDLNDLTGHWTDLVGIPRTVRRSNVAPDAWVAEWDDESLDPVIHSGETIRKRWTRIPTGDVDGTPADSDRNTVRSDFQPPTGTVTPPEPSPGRTATTGKFYGVPFMVLPEDVPIPGGWMLIDTPTAELLAARHGVNIPTEPPALSSKDAADAAEVVRRMAADTRTAEKIRDEYGVKPAGDSAEWSDDDMTSEAAPVDVPGPWAPVAYPDAHPDHMVVTREWAASIKDEIAAHERAIEKADRIQVERIGYLGGQVKALLGRIDTEGSALSARIGKLERKTKRDRRRHHSFDSALDGVLDRIHHRLEGVERTLSGATWRPEKPADPARHELTLADAAGGRYVTLACTCDRWSSSIDGDQAAVIFATKLNLALGSHRRHLTDITNGGDGA